MFNTFYNNLTKCYNSSYDTDEIMTEINNYPWDEVQEYIFKILLDNNKMKYWGFLITAISRVVSENKKSTKNIDKDYLLAILESCLLEIDEEKYGEIDGEVIWSITMDLENINYLDDYELNESAKAHLIEISKKRIFSSKK